MCEFEETGLRLKALREAEKLSQEAFGAKLGVTKSAISRVELGHRNLTKQMKCAIESVFYANIDWLETGCGNMYKDVSENELAIVKLATKEHSQIMQQLLLEIDALSDTDAELMLSLVNRLKKETSSN